VHFLRIIAKIYADCLYRFTLDRQARFRGPQQSFNQRPYARAWSRSLCRSRALRPPRRRQNNRVLQGGPRGWSCSLPSSSQGTLHRACPLRTRQHVIRQTATKKTYGELERLHETQRLIDGTSDGQVVHRDLPTGQVAPSARREENQPYLSTPLGSIR
jgi:hypothetical protein